eukprot:198525_1
MAEWTWDDTMLDSYIYSKYLIVKDIKQLLRTRGAKGKDINKKKKELIKLLKSDSRYSKPKLKESELQQLSTKALSVELKLFTSFFPKMSNKDELILLLEIEYIKRVQSKPILVNNNEYIVAGQTALHKYNINQKEWSEYIKYPESIKLNCSTISIAMNHRDHKIYICQGSSQLLMINTQTKKSEIIDTELNNTLSIYGDTKLAVIDSELNLINTSCKHLIFDDTTKELKEFRDFALTNCSNIYFNYDLIYLSSKHKMIRFQGNGVADIHEYCCNTKKWKLLDVYGPWNISDGIRCVVTTDEQYVFILDQGTGDIFFANTDDWEFKLSLIQCPKIYNVIIDSGYVNVIIIDNQRKKDLLAVGFIRRVWKKYNIGMNRFLPQYLMKLIEARFTCEQLQFFIRNYSPQISIPLENVMK